jgi:hypothetical protein
MFRFFVLSLCLLLTGLANAQQLVVYPVAHAAYYSMHNNDYTVLVRRSGGPWINLYEYNVKVDMERPQDASMVYFDFSGKVEIFVRKNNGNIRSVKIRPSELGIKYTKNGNTISFFLTKPENLSVEFNGDKLHNLHLFANPVERGIPDTTSPDVMYFGPGIHQPPANMKGQYKIPSNTMVYISGSAIVKGRLVCDHVKNVRIMGRGIIDRPTSGILINGCQNISIEGITFIDPRYNTITVGNSKDVFIDNVKSFSYQGWGDGFDFFCSSDIKVDHVFLRNSDDCIAIYGHRWQYFGNGRNYLITNSSLWADVAHPINIGTHGDTETKADTLENIRFENINILQESEHDPEYQGCMAISDGDDNLIKDVYFQHINIDDFDEGMLLNLRVVDNNKYNTAPGRGVERIYFRNINYNGINILPSVIHGYDEDRLVKDITFENLRINGKLILNASAGNIDIGNYTRDITFKK